MRKYDFYIVKVIVNNVEKVVETNRDKTSFKEMRELYSITKEKLTCGNVMFIGINSTEYNVILSKTIEKEEEMDTVISNLIENIKWIIDYSSKSDELLGSMNMSKDMFLKNIELFEDYLIDDEAINRQKKEDIFDELKRILLLRRKVKYNNLLVDKINARLNLKDILKALEDAVKSISNNTCVNLSKSDIEKQKEHSIRDFFNMDTIEKISEMRKENDKLLITENKIVGYNKSKNKTEVKSDTKCKIESEINKYELEVNRFKSRNAVSGDIIYIESKLNLGLDNLICIDKTSFSNVQESHVKNFIKNKSKEFNLMTKKKSTINCYKFALAE